MSPDVILLSIGVIILIAGLLLYAAGKRGGLAITLLGGLWTIAMVIYYIYSNLGFYAAVGLNTSSAGPVVTTTLGFLILIIGIGVAVYVARRGGRK
ncbi:hypothetical protein ACSU1N_00125 [Thermogladius sp. 4427co]|uniref:hypothetical protein n=1 Tax=Thermogladius sp. 4427co TaxID=3450718 RepID=UPI003F799D2B